MASGEPKSLFRRLTRLFRSGPIVKRKIRALDTAIAVPDKTKSSGTLLFQKSLSPTYATITSNAYNLSERLMRYQDFQEMEYTPEIAAAMDIYADETVAADEKGRCLHVYSDNEKVRELLEDLFYNVLNVEFNLRSWARNLPVHKDTVIPLLDGRNITIEQLAREHDDGKQNWVYSVQDGTHRTVPGKVAWCGLTRKDSELVRVWLDDGSYVDCTPDHRFKLRDGSSKEAVALAEGDSLMPFYRKVSSRTDGAAMDGYEEIYDAASGRYVYTHRRIAEVLEKGTLKDGRWLVTHHKDFNKRNNDPQNLVMMDEKEHMELHKQLAIELLHSPEVTAKRIAGIDRWLRSDEHKVIAREQLKKLQADGLMKTSWDDYNSSTQFKQDNSKRSELKKRMWADDTRRSRAQANMTIKFDARCVDMIVDVLWAHGKYVSPKVLGNQLKADDAFMGHFRGINGGIKRDLTKALNSHSGFEALLNKAGVASYLQLVRDRLPDVAATPWFKRVEKKSAKMSGVVPTMRLNHKVAKVERLTQTSDVYCMEVLGPAGEHDRHNFMILTTSGEGLSTSGCDRSGICLENCKYGDFFLYNDVSPEYGVVNAFPIPVNEVEREENYDRDDPFAVRYRWVTLGNRTLENWEVTHFRLLGNDMFLPYGSSIIEPARRIWRQLILIEDAMLVYRVVRAPERRVFYIDVANLPPQDVNAYVEQQRQQMRTTPVVDRSTGRVDLRYNPMCLSLGTRVKLQDGRSPSLSELITEWDAGKQDQWVYSVDPVTRRYVPGKVTWAGLTRKDAELVRVHLDDGTYRDVTPDHRFMLRDGTYEKAEGLRPGQPLMPLYVKLSSKEDGDRIEGYEQVYDPATESFVYTHRQNVIETQGFDALVGKVVHHDDHDKLNNSPTNLVPMTWVEHQRHHADAVVEYNTSARGRENSRRRMRKTWTQGKITSDTMVALWNDKDVRDKRVRALTLDVGDRLLSHCFRIMDVIGRGLSTREAEFIDACNADVGLQEYIRALNPTFKNGHVDRFTHGNLQIMLRKAGLPKSLESLKRAWLLARYDIGGIRQFCTATPGCTRKQVLLRFGLGRSSFEELVRLNGTTPAQFAEQHLPGNTRYVGYKNHCVVRVERLQVREDTGCINVERWHNFAAGPAVDQLDERRQQANSWILLHNSVEEDYFIPVRGGDTGTKIDTLAGGQNAAAVEDVAYIQKKLFAALKIPRAYLGYDEMLSSKATLAQEDIRFSRTISVIQKTILAELNKLAIIHLYAHGYDSEDLQNFTLRLSNPSTVAQQQKLELWRAKFEIAGTAPEGMVTKEFIRKEILTLNDEQISDMDDKRLKEKLIDATIEAATPEGAEGGEGGGGGEDVFGGGDEGPAGGEEEPAGGAEEKKGGETPPPENAGEEPEEEVEPETQLLVGSVDLSDDEDFPLKLQAIKDRPITVKSQLQKSLYNRSRRRTHGASKTHMPDFVKMTSTDNHSMEDPYDSDWIGSVVSNPFGEGVTRSVRLTSDIKAMLGKMSSAWPSAAAGSPLLVEGRDVQDEIDVANGALGEGLGPIVDEAQDDELLIDEGNEDDE